MNTRRHFIRGASSAAMATFAAKSSAQDAGANSRLRVAVMGLGRGKDHIKGWLGVPNVEIAYLCDVDSRRAGEGARVVEKSGQSAAPKLVQDLRRILDQKDVDLVSIAAPNFWHAPATIMACAAGKHVYVEKPGSYDIREGEMMVKAARKHGRKVQQGTQRRSIDSVREAMAKLKAGVIGKVRSVHCHYAANRGSIGQGKPAPIPEWLNWDLWQGPVPELPYKDNLVHYNWHWLWHYGGGEMANNGVHSLDLALMGLDSPLPRRVTFNGGRYHFRDDQQTPDTGAAVFDFGEFDLQWEVTSCLPRKQENLSIVTFYGEGGTLEIDNIDYKILDSQGKEVERKEGQFSDIPHFQNLANAIRRDEPLNCEIETAQRSTLLCHLGNIAYRTGSVVNYDPDARKILANPEAEKLLGRSYRPGWELEKLA